MTGRRYANIDRGEFYDTFSIPMKVKKTATVADLRNNFATLSKWIHEGDAILITKRGIPFVTLTPVRKRQKFPPVDRLVRLKKLFPEGPVGGDSRAVVDYDRGDR